MTAKYYIVISWEFIISFSEKKKEGEESYDEEHDTVAPGGTPAANERHEKGEDSDDDDTGSNVL